MSNSLQKGNIPYHLGDMAEKILNTAEDLPGLFRSNSYQLQLDEIRRLIGGNFTVDEKTKQLYFLRNGISIPAVSVASGIKSFGVLYVCYRRTVFPHRKCSFWMNRKSIYIRSGR